MFPSFFFIVFLLLAPNFVFETLVCVVFVLAVKRVQIPWLLKSKARIQPILLHHRKLIFHVFACFLSHYHTPIWFGNEHRFLSSAWFEAHSLFFSGLYLFSHQIYVGLDDFLLLRKKCHFGFSGIYSANDCCNFFRPKNIYKDPDDGQQRFLLELEFVQCLANPTYIHCMIFTLIW